MIADLLQGIRAFRQRPLFAVAVTLILALGIGVNTAVFSVVDAVLIRRLPYESSGRVIRIDETSTRRLVSGVPAPDYLRWANRSDLFEQPIAYVKDWVTLTGGAEPDQALALRTSGALFSLIGAHARLGRALTASDDEPASPKVAVLSDRVWAKLFHADPRVIGRTITIADEAYTVAGVMPREFEFQYPDAELWVPLRLTPASTGLFQAIARMKPGVSLEQV